MQSIMDFEKQQRLALNRLLLFFLSQKQITFKYIQPIDNIHLKPVHMQETARTLRKKNKSKRKRIIQKSYKRWSQEENAMYAFFLHQNQADFQSQWRRRSTKVYLRLSKLLGSKSINQCKSHHQKMLKYCKTISEIVSKFFPAQFANMLSNQEQGGKVKIQDQYSTYTCFIKEEPKQTYIYDVSNCYLSTLDNSGPKSQLEKSEPLQVMPVFIVNGEGKNI